MFGDIKKKISITSLMFNVGFYSSYSMDYESTYVGADLRPEDLSINSADEISNEISEKSHIYENKKTNVKKGCSVKKKLLITGIASLGLIVIGTCLYFLLRDKNNNDDIIPPVPIPETNNFTDRITEIITNSISNVVTIDAVIIPTDRIITNDTDLIPNIHGPVPEDKCEDLSMNCSDPNLIEHLKNNIIPCNLTENDDYCFGNSKRESIKFLFNNNSNCQLNFFNKDFVYNFTLKNYSYDSIDISGNLDIENYYNVFHNFNVNTIDFTNLNFSKVLNFSNFLINSNITNVYGLNNILVDEKKDIVNFIKNCQFTNLEIKYMTVNNKTSISSIIKDSTIDNTLDMSNYKTDNTHYFEILKNTTVKYINMKNINVRNSDLYIIGDFKNIDLNNCSISDSNLDRLFCINTGISVNMSYCNLTNVDFCSSFSSFHGYSVDISNTYFHLYQRRTCPIFHSSNISYLNVSNSIFANIEYGLSMFEKGWFKTVNLTNTKADNLLSFASGFYQSTFDNVIMHNFSTKSLTSCEAMFYGIKSNGNIRSIDISGWDMGNIIYMNDMFYFTNDNNVKNIQYINASFININNKDKIESEDFVAYKDLTDLKNIWFDFNNFTKLIDSVTSSGFNCTGYSCHNPRFTLGNNKNSSITKSNNIVTIKNKNKNITFN